MILNTGAGGTVYAALLDVMLPIILKKINLTDYIRYLPLFIMSVTRSVGAGIYIEDFAHRLDKRFFVTAYPSFKLC